MHWFFFVGYKLALSHKTIILIIHAGNSCQIKTFLYMYILFIKLQ